MIEEQNKYNQKHRDERIQYGKNYYQKNKEEISEKTKVYYQNNREDKLEKSKNYYKEHKEEAILYQKEYREEHKEERSVQKKEHYQEHKEEILENNKNYREEHKEEIAEYRKGYYQNNKKQIRKQKNKYEKEKRNNNPYFKLYKNISRSISRALKSHGSSKNGHSIEEFLLASISEMWNHIESQFEWWMTRENQGCYIAAEWDDNDPTTWKWQLDHIKPHSEFHYETMDCEEFRQCWALSNLRPLSAKQNLLDGVNRTRHQCPNS